MATQFKQDRFRRFLFQKWELKQLEEKTMLQDFSITSRLNRISESKQINTFRSNNSQPEARKRTKPGILKRLSLSRGYESDVRYVLPSEQGAIVAPINHKKDVTGVLRNKATSQNYTLQLVSNQAPLPRYNARITHVRCDCVANKQKFVPRCVANRRFAQKVCTEGLHRRFAQRFAQEFTTAKLSKQHQKLFGETQTQFAVRQTKLSLSEKQTL